MYHLDSYQSRLTNGDSVTSCCERITALKARRSLSTGTTCYVLSTNSLFGGFVFQFDQDEKSEFQTIFQRNNFTRQAVRTIWISKSIIISFRICIISLVSGVVNLIFFVQWKKLEMLFFEKPSDVILDRLSF